MKACRRAMYGAWLSVLLMGMMGSFTTALGIEAGEYYADEYSGLIITEAAHHRGEVPRYHFSLDTLGANGHTCSLAGEIVGNQAQLIEEEGEICQIDFQQRENGIDVMLSDEDSFSVCRYYCGMRAWFTGFYHQSMESCAWDARAKSQRRGGDLYRAGRYGEAAELFQGLLTKCEPILTWRGEGALRNDLALTYAKKGDSASCYRALEPYLLDALLHDEEIERFVGVSDEEDYLAIIKAARVNLGWCERARE